MFNILTITVTLTIASGGKETESRSLHLFLDEQFQKSNNNHPNGNNTINLPNGIFSSCGYPVISRTLILEGMKTELHISAEQNALETETENGIDSSSADDNWQLSMFRIRNSTVSLTSLCLHSEGRSTLIASVSSSFVRVSESDIRSNGMNSPFVMLVGMGDGPSGDIGSCLDIWNCCHISSSLLSLVPLAELSRKSDLAVNAGKGWTAIEERGFASSIRISARSLSICDCCLTFGTGPLIGFGRSTDMTELGKEHAALPWKASSQLISSCIMNTTSKPSNWKANKLSGMELTQVVTGTHQAPTHAAFFKLCTFKDCSSSTLSGGAISHFNKSSLHVEGCSLETCHAEVSKNGGAIFFDTNAGATFIATSSSFVGCSAVNYAGSIQILNAKSTSLIDCVFVDSESKYYGGCVYTSFWNALLTSSSITNCIFENCRTTYSDTLVTYSGGALFITNAVSIQLNFVNFRGNKAGTNPGNDMFFAGTPSSLITSETIVGCTSTSESFRIRVASATEGTDDCLPRPTTTVTHDSCVGTAVDSDTAEFTLKMSEPITGTVLVLIDNSGGTRTPTGEQAPNIGRVLSFSLDNTDSSSCSVSLGESSLVQTPIDAYSVVKSSFVGSFILSANCVLDESEKNALITISGQNIPPGILSVTLSDNTVLDFEFLPNQSISKKLSVPLTETSPKLRYGETFKIVSAQSKTLPNQHVAVPSLLNLVIPNPPRLTTLNEAEYDSALKTVRISLEGVNLEGTYKVTLSVNGTETVTIDVVFSSSKGQLGGILFDTDTPTNVNMSFNTRYEIVEMKKDDVSVLRLGDFSFKTKTEPTRLVIMECGYDEGKKNALIRMTGRVLDSTKEYEIELNDSGNSKKTIEMRFNPTLSEWEGSAILYSQSESVELEYGMTYSVSGFKTKGETPLHLHEDLTITIDDEPSRIEDMSRVLDGEKTKMIISLSGRELKSGMGKIGVCRGSTKWTSDTAIVSGSDGKWKAEFLVGFSESSTVLKYGSTYTLCGLDGSAFFVNDRITITVPHAPVVSSMIPELNASTHSSFRVVLSGSDLPASGSFTASFSESAGTFVISLSESSEWRSDWIVVSTTSAFEFNTTYTLTSLIDLSSGTADHLLCSGVTMTTPLGPTLTGLGGVSLTGALLDCVSIVVNVSRIVADTFEVSVLDVDDAWKVPIALSISFSSCDWTEGVMTHSVSWDSVLQTFIKIHLSGNDLIGKYAVTLTSGLSFIVTAESSTSAVSEEIALGWPDSLAFDTPFTIQSIVSMNPDSVVFLKDTLSFTSPKKPDPLSLFVDGRTGEMSRFCGESSRPCSSVEVGWEIVSQLGVRRPTIGIVDSATLGSPIRVENGMVALLSNFGNVDPKLRIPSSACESVESGMIVVSSSTLEIRDIDIVIDSLSPSFVLLFASNSNLTLKEGSFVGPQSPPSSNDGLSEEMCDWMSGILQLDNCTTTISDMKLNHLSFGTVNMRNGSLEVVTSSFHANSPHLSSFPSLRRNIHCSDGGHIEIGSLTGGDGDLDKMGWFSRSDCTLSGDGVDIRTAFFAPTLNTNESKTTFTKKTGTFEVEIVGTILIPCGLLLEVFELTKDKKEGNQLRFELNLDSTQSFTEKNIKLAISQASLKELKGELEWRGRLVFGESHQTVESILIQKTISERRSQAVLDNMKWWLPVVIVASCALLVVIVIVVVCRRRRKNEKRTGATTTLSEMEQQEGDVEKIAVDVEDEHNLALIRTTREEQYHQETEKEERPFEESTRKDCGDDAIKVEEIEAVVCDGDVKVEVVGKRETLFERLHGRNKKAVDAIAVCRALIKGLVTAGKDARLNGALLTLSPHTVVVDSSNRICILQPSEVKEKVGVELGKEMNGSVVEGEERWRAPEQGDKKIEAGIASEKVSVFRLGLLLVEMWTGRIPFGETDGVNASRQLGIGILPPLGGMCCEMSELVGKCLSVDCGYRPRLLEMDELLESLSKKDGQKVEEGEGQKNAAGQTEMLGVQSLVS
ncbi:hypothetical protein BLNAU_3828 [Blattamonas nauphoetae]|uniref:Protein kinase domain-containing protein n=1 Tax=Blattamonas nauphoetae TaxID=2049346 RepID=A0ABQ9YBC0_9EUKA|nr:hypothetical protein BLNAU_3828 [Blattamonas nauphoetae]